MKYTTFIFDFDFTLADASDGIVESVNYAMAKMGMEPKKRDEIRRTVGMTLNNAFYALTGKTDADAAARFIECFVEKADSVMTPNTVLLPDTVSTLKRLKEQGFKTGIVTSKLRYRVSEVLEKFYIADLMDCIIGFEDVEQAKPSVEGLLKAIDLLGASLENTLYTGDSLIDAETAKNAGVDFAAVTTGTTKASEFDAFPRIAVLNGLSEIFTVLD